MSEMFSISKLGVRRTIRFPQDGMEKADYEKRVLDHKYSPPSCLNAYGPGTALFLFVCMVSGLARPED